MTKDFRDREVDFVTSTKNDNGNFIANCNTIRFLNTGTATVMIDSQQRVLPNMAIEDQCWPGELNKHTYEITFLNPNGNLVQNLVITRKVYKDKIV